jgi:Sulfotransferase domain
MVAHHGIERSGTNILEAALHCIGVVTANGFLNDDDNVPGHKHFRIQDGNSSGVMNPIHEHLWSPSTIQEYSENAGLLSTTKHVVIFKDPANWLVSINRYGAEAGWPGGGQILDDPFLRVTYLREWSEYYKAWEAFAQAEPHLVLLVQYEVWMQDFTAGLQRIAEFVGVNGRLKRRSALDIKVYQSGKRSSITFDINNPELAQRVYDEVTWNSFDHFN